MTDHCPACTIARDLTDHRDSWGGESTATGAALNFARVIAMRACPDYQPANEEIADA